MSYKILSGHKIPLINFLKIAELDAKAYGKSYHLSFGKGLFWVLKNYSGYIMIKSKDNKPIAYASVISLKEKYYNLLKNGEIKDTDLPLKALVRLNKKGLHNLYFSSIVIAEEYKNTNVFFLLVNELLKLPLRFVKKDVYFSSVLVDAVSEKGKKFAETFHLDFIKNTDRNSSIYEIKLIPLKYTFKGANGQKINELYINKTKELSL